MAEKGRLRIDLDFELCHMLCFEYAQCNVTGMAIWSQLCELIHAVRDSYIFIHWARVATNRGYIFINGGYMFAIWSSYVLNGASSLVNGEQLSKAIILT